MDVNPCVPRSQRVMSDPQELESQTAVSYKCGCWESNSSPLSHLPSPKSHGYKFKRVAKKTKDLVWSRKARLVCGPFSSASPALPQCCGRDPGPTPSRLGLHHSATLGSASPHFVWSRGLGPAIMLFTHSTIVQRSVRCPRDILTSQQMG